MKRQPIFAVLLAAGVSFLVSNAFSHGGTYRGPGDVVPGGGGGGGGGGSTPTGPGGTGSPGGGGSGGATGAPTAGGSPTGGPGGARGPVLTGAAGGSDRTTWESWWGFNKAPYLNLRAAIHGGGPATGDIFHTTPGEMKGRDIYKPSAETVRVEIVPALLRALETEKANDIVTGALVALARIGDVRREDGTSELGAKIAGFLGDSNQEIAETAALALGILEHESSVPVLESLLRDTKEARKLVGRGEVPYRTRAFAAYGLGLVGNAAASRETRREIVRTLMGFVEEAKSSTRDVQVAALLGIGLVPIEVLPEEVGESSVDPTASRQTQVRWIARVLADERQAWMVRAHAPQVLGKLLAGCPTPLRDEIARRLLELTAERSKAEDQIQHGCVIALGMIGACDGDPGDVRIREALVRISRGRDYEAGHFALIALGQIAGRRGAGEEPAVGRPAITAHLLDTLTRGRSADRPWAGLAIGVLEHALAAAGEEPSMAVRQALQESLSRAGNPRDVGAFAIGTGIAGNRDAAKILRTKFEATKEDNARSYIAVAIGLLGDRDAIEEIRTVVRESKFRPELLREAAIGLGLLGDKELVTELVTMLQEAKSLSVQASIATALGFIGDERSVSPLVLLLERKDVTPSARGFAAVALGLVADKEPLPWNSKISVDVNYPASTSTLTGAGTGVLDIL
ncbi:MAG: HEAT repeat domain-containing protein [Planctomycetota bacterium]